MYVADELLYLLLSISMIQMKHKCFWWKNILPTLSNYQKCWSINCFPNININLQMLWSSLSSLHWCILGFLLFLFIQRNDMVWKCAMLHSRLKEQGPVIKWSRKGKQKQPIVIFLYWCDGLYKKFCSRCWVLS